MYAMQACWFWATIEEKGLFALRSDLKMHKYCDRAKRWEPSLEFEGSKRTVCCLLLGHYECIGVWVCRLESDEQEFVLQQEEVVAAGWHSLAEVEQFPVFAGPVLSSMFASCKAYAEGRFSGISAEKLANGFNARSSLVLQV